MVGDQARDMVAGRLAGCTTLMVGGPPSSDACVDADHACVNLSAAARLIVQLEKSSLTIH
jgi:phosphoglycolate phosphatase-like HAD superfamily hydrolase